jgi:carbonic anhydrase
MHFSVALDKLKQGNRRFVSGLRSVEAIAAGNGKRRELAEMGQKPFAMILSCADSRVPAEMVFDCGLGDLFVVRVAGNIVAPSLIGSLEFAAENFGTTLCVVMGHSQCGAVSASVKTVQANGRADSDNIQNIVLEIAPSVRKSIELVGPADHNSIVKTCTSLNVAHSVQMLQDRSGVISRLVAEGKLMLAGAVYDLHSGEVTFLDNTVHMDAPSRRGKAPAALSANGSASHGAPV